MERRDDPIDVEHRLTLVETTVAFELKQLNKGMAEVGKAVKEVARLQREANGHVGTLEQRLTDHMERGEGCPLFHRVEALESVTDVEERQQAEMAAYDQGAMDEKAKIRNRDRLFIGGVAGIILFALDVIDKGIANIVPWLNGR